jgi:hypothetical protein
LLSFSPFLPLFLFFFSLFCSLPLSLTHTRSLALFLSLSLSLSRFLSLALFLSLSLSLSLSLFRALLLLTLSRSLNHGPWTVDPAMPPRPHHYTRTPKPQPSNRRRGRCGISCPELSTMSPDTIPHPTPLPLQGYLAHTKPPPPLGPP